MIRKQIYLTKEELRWLDICMSNDYVGAIVSTRWINYLDKYNVVVEFDSKEELKQFCGMYGYKVSRVGDKCVLNKIES